MCVIFLEWGSYCYYWTGWFSSFDKPTDHWHTSTTIRKYFPCLNVPWKYSWVKSKSKRRHLVHAPIYAVKSKSQNCIMLAFSSCNLTAFLLSARTQIHEQYGLWAYCFFPFLTYRVILYQVQISLAENPGLKAENKEVYGHFPVSRRSTRVGTENTKNLQKVVAL